MGVILGIADRLAARDETGGRHRARQASASRSKELSVKDGLLFGFCQAMALIPGVSRSGATISGGLLMGYTPRGRGPLLLPARHPGRAGLGPVRAEGRRRGAMSPGGPTVFATVIAFVVGYAVIAWFMKFISTKSFMPFVIYRILLGIVLFALVGAGVLSPHAGESAG